MTTKVIDPVCGMEVDTASAAGRSEREGKDYYFCSAVCKARFDSEVAPPMSNLVNLTPMSVARTTTVATEPDVERVDLPVAQTKPVVAQAGWPCTRTEVVEIRHGARLLVVVIARGWTRTCLVPAPRGVVAVAKTLCAATSSPLPNSLTPSRRLAPSPRRRPP